jgi:hypothetical protein
VTRVVVRVLVGLLVALLAGLLGGPQRATAADPLAPTGHAPTQGAPVPGGYLTADLGSWTAAPDSYQLRWLRDGVPVDGATAQDYLVQAADVGHLLAPEVTARSGTETASYVGDPVVVRRLASTVSLDVRRVHPAPGANRLVWTAIAYLATERPWSTDGGTVTAYKKKDGRLKRLGSATVSRGLGLVRLPWKRAPHGASRVMVCFAGSDAVEVSCSRYDVVRRR